MNQRHQHHIEALIDRVDAYGGFVTEDQNVRIAFQNFQEVLVRAMRNYLKKAQGLSDDRDAVVYLHEIDYLANSIEEWGKRIK
tara:strand:- start:3602 stop:3850 length:249 start_codon:yes stop_codon:yes gene_type:complete